MFPDEIEHCRVLLLGGECHPHFQDPAWQKIVRHSVADIATLPTGVLDAAFFSGAITSNEVPGILSEFRRVLFIGGFALLVVRDSDVTKENLYSAILQAGFGSAVTARNVKTGEVWGLGYPRKVYQAQIDEEGAELFL